MQRPWLVFLATLLCSNLVYAEVLVHGLIKEWPVPWPGTRPRDPFVAPDGLVWFVGQVGHYLASFDPETEKFQRFDLEDGTGPHNLIVAADGKVWYAGNRAAHIGRLDPKSGEITEYPMPDADAIDPHTLAFDVKGDIWFTVQGGNFVGHLKPDTGNIRLVGVSTPGARPYGIAVAADGHPWIAELGSNKLATVEPGTLTLREIPLPRKEARPRRVGITSDGQVWYVDYAGGYLGRYNPQSGEIHEWRAPSADKSGPYGMAIDDRDRIWFVETWVSPNLMVGFDTVTEEFFGITTIPSGGGSVRHMYFDPRTRQIWFGTDTNNLGRFEVPE